VKPRVASSRGPSAASNNGAAPIDREFVSAIRDEREPNGSLAQRLDATRALDGAEKPLRK
jgi:2-hydroxy-4-carboxymuconate semialdehyde hemiacetal dehydrogenase